MIFLKSKSEGRSELCELVAKFMAIHLEEQNNSFKKLIAALEERDELKQKLKRMKHK